MMNAIKYEIRDMQPGEEYILKDMLYDLISCDEISENGRFLKVKLPSSEIGCIRKSFVSNLKVICDMKDEEKLRENLAKSALSYLGTQYRWGGKSPLGIDCFGLCSRAYILNGIIMNI